MVFGGDGPPGAAAAIGRKPPARPSHGLRVILRHLRDHAAEAPAARRCARRENGSAAVVDSVRAHRQSQARCTHQLAARCVSGSRLAPWRQSAAALAGQFAETSARCFFARRKDECLDRGRMSEYLAARGIPESKLCVIENWADGDAIQPKPPSTSILRARLGLVDHFVVCYSGNLGRAQEFETLLGAAEALNGERIFIFLIIGSGAKMEGLKRAVAERALENFCFLPYQPRDTLEDSLAAGDVHLVSLLPALEGLIVPSKLYGILAAGRPLIFIGDTGGDIGRVIERSQCGRLVRVGDSTALEYTLRNLEGERESLARLGARARQLLCEEYDLRRAIERWVVLIEAA